MSDHSWCTPKPLAVRTRCIVGHGRPLFDATVHCPWRAISISATECLACGDCAGSACGPDGRTYLHCAHPAVQQAALAELMRRPLFASAADRTPLAQFMTGDVICVLPDLGLGALIDLLLERNIGGAPVVDEAGRPIGIVSKSDLVGGSFPAGTTVADVMMPMAFVLPETATLSQAAALMAFEGVHRIPVVSTEGRVVGIVSSLDVARWLAQNDGYLEPGSNSLADRSKDEAL